MNLHDIILPLAHVALWLHAYGANGRPIGDHLWEVPEGTPPDFQFGGSPYARQYSQPTRYQWRPFSAWRHIFQNGYIPPLCGQRSASRRPRVSTPYQQGTCEGCIAAANQRSIIPLTYAEATQQSPVFRAAAEEAQAWNAAGRPDVWPLTPSN